MSRTTTQIESSIDNSETIKLMEYLKDYLTKITNLNTDKLNTLLQDIYNKVNGLTTIIGHLGRPLEPAAADPDIATTEEYSWYFNTTTKAFKMLHNGAWIVIATLTGTVDLSEYLKTTDADAKYEARSYDFSNTETPLTYNLTNAKRFQIISKPSGADDTPIGLTNKIVIKVATTDPSELPQDADQITYGSDLLWVVLANGDIVTWDEIKDNVNDKKIMVIKHLSNGNWELVRWEVSNDKKYSSIDLTTANVGTGNAGKIFQVKADGTIEYVAKPKEYTFQEHWKNGQTSFSVVVPNDEEITSWNFGIVKDDSDNLNADILRISDTKWEVYWGKHAERWRQGYIIRTGNTFEWDNHPYDGGNRISVSITLFTRKEK